jgi:hypothetical protein
VSAVLTGWFAAVHGSRPGKIGSQKNSQRPVNFSPEQVSHRYALVHRRQQRLPVLNYGKLTPQFRQDTRIVKM